MTKVNLNTSGIYQITCLANSKIYIGSAKNIRMRWKLHRTHLRMGISHNKPMQKAWKKYGELFFSFEVLEFCDLEAITATEQKWLDLKRPFDRGVGFNVLKTAYSSIGHKHSDEVRARLSEIAKSRSHEHLRAFNDARRGKPGKKGVTGWVWTDEQKKAASKRRAGCTAWNKGIPASEETKIKISEACKGKGRTVQDDQVAEIKHLRSMGLTYNAISLKTGVSLSHCCKIVNDNTGRYRKRGSFRSFEKSKGLAK